MASKATSINLAKWVLKDRRLERIRLCARCGFPTPLRLGDLELAKTLADSSASDQASQICEFTQFVRSVLGLGPLGNTPLVASVQLGNSQSCI